MELGKKRTIRIQMRNLIQNLRRDNAAISVPGAGKTVEALPIHIVGWRLWFTIIRGLSKECICRMGGRIRSVLGIKGNDIYRATGTNEELESVLLHNDNPPKVILVNYNVCG